VLDESFDVVDYISLHAYYEELDGDLASFLGSADDFDRFIEQVVATVDRVAQKRNSSKRIALSVDEWNVWYLSHIQAADPRRPFSATTPRLSEEPYTVADAVVVGNLLISLLRHADRVTCACLAQLVNTIAPIHAEPGGPAWRKSTFYPFSLTAANAKGSVVGLSIGSPTITTPKHGDIAAVDAVATLDAEIGQLAVFAVNRSPAEPFELVLDLSGLGEIGSACVLMLSDADPHAANTADAQGRVVPATTRVAPGSDGLVRLTLPPVSWSAVTAALPTR
jgi:alpha-L-arabinofuranosidase